MTLLSLNIFILLVNYLALTLKVSLVRLKDCIAVSGIKVIIYAVRAPCFQTLLRLRILLLHGVFVLDLVHDDITIFSYVAA